MSQLRENDQNLRLGFISEDYYQDLLSPNFYARLEAAQLISKNLSSQTEPPNIDTKSFIVFAKPFLIDENFGVINAFSEVVETVFHMSDSSIMQSSLNQAIELLVPALHDKRRAVRNLSSNLIVKYITISKSPDLFDHLTSIFYNDTINSQIEILEIAGQLIALSEPHFNSSEFNQKLNNLIDNAFLIVNSVLRQSAIKFIRLVKDYKPEVYSLVSEDIKKIAENDNTLSFAPTRCPKTPTSALPPIHPNFNLRSIQSQSQYMPQNDDFQKIPDTAKTKHRTDEFWYRSKPRFAKTAGFIINKSGQLAPKTPQHPFATTMREISAIPISKTPEPLFQPKEPYSPFVSDEPPFDKAQYEQVHVYDQVCTNSYEPEEDKHSDEITDPALSNFDILPEPRKVNRVQNNKPSVIMINDQTELKNDKSDNKPFVNFELPPKKAESANNTENKTTSQSKIKFFDDFQFAVHEPQLEIDDQQPKDNQSIQQRTKRPFKLHPPPVALNADDTENSFNNCNSALPIVPVDGLFDDQPSLEELRIQKLPFAQKETRKRATRSFNASLTNAPPGPFKKAPSTSANPRRRSFANTTKDSGRSKPDMSTLLADLQSSSDWERQNCALQRLTSWTSSDPTFVTSNLRVICFEVVPLCSSIRSALSKTALECLIEIAGKFGNDMTPFFEAIVNDLLTILLSSKGFISRLATNSISTIMNNVGRKKAFEYLSSDHKKRPGSCKACLSMCLSELVTKNCEEINNSNVNDIEQSEPFMKTIGNFITDANPESRKHARNAVKTLSSKYPNLSSLVTNMSLDESERKAILSSI